jgi:AsmA protein
MRRFFKILISMVGIVVVLLILAAVALPMVYDREDLEKAIAARVNKQTGRDLAINGALDFSVFPWLAVEVGDLKLSNADGFGEHDFAHIGRARVGVALMPLFQKKIVVDEITLHDLNLSLAVNAQGRNNWEDLAAGPEDETTSPADEEASLFSSQRIAGLNVRNAMIEFEDRQANTHFRLSDFSMSTGALGEGTPLPLELSALLEDLAGGSAHRLKMAAIASIDLDTERYDFSDFELSLSEASEQGPSISVKAPLLSTDLSAQTLEMGSFVVETAGLQAQGDLTASNILDGPSFRGRVSLPEFSPLVVMQALQMDAPSTSDPEVLQSAQMSASFQGDERQLDLKNITFRLDQSQFDGELSVRNFDQPAVDFDFQVDTIDIDRYLEPVQDQAESADVAMPKEELQGQDIRGRLAIGQLHMAGLDFNDARLGLTVSKGKLRLNPLTADFYDGRYSGDVRIDSSGAVPVLSLDENIDAITFQKLVADLVETESLSGMALGHVKLTGRGASSNEVLSSLNGDLGLTLTEGALEGINVWYEIRRAFALYKGMPAPPEEPNRTVFSRMALDASVRDGVVTTREFVGELPFLTLRGEGAVNLASSSVDLGLVASVRNTPDLAQDPLAADLGGKSVPFKISGTLDDPGISVDWEALLKSEATDMLLDKLGLSKGSSDNSDSADRQEEGSDQDQLEEAATNALFDLLQGKDKDKDDGS